jgi:hypothetical protein
MKYFNLALNHSQILSSCYTIYTIVYTRCTLLTFVGRDIEPYGVSFIPLGFILSLDGKGATS